jgi:fumarate hydratase subunit alpha
MKIIKAQKITETVRELCIRANLELRDDVLSAIKLARGKEKNRRAKHILKAIIDNAAIARKEKLAICQDTGLPSVFIALGQDLKIEGDLQKAVHKGIEEGYRKGYLRNSVIRDPIKRSKSFYSPGIIHLDLVRGNKIKITVVPKGFGCENKTQLKMFNPTAKIEEIKKFIVDAVSSAGPDACPPYVVGVGIGGTADFASLLAKKALLRKLNTQYSKLNTQNSKLECDLLREINKLNIGPMGLGGKTTALAVNIESYPTHIAGLPVAVNISCHALRGATLTL